MLYPVKGIIRGVRAAYGLLGTRPTPPVHETLLPYQSRLFLRIVLKTFVQFNENHEYNGNGFDFNKVAEKIRIR